MSPEAFSLPSFAKINLHLEILGKRADGFHELCTVFQTVSLHDVIRFEASDTLTLACSDRRIPTDDRNLVLKAAKALRQRSGTPHGAKIYLEKQIPSPGGLGGGSSNAAAALIGLSRLWNIGMSREDVLEIGGTLGSDVPFFFYGGTALGTGRGEHIEPLDDILEECLLIVTPNVRVSTRTAFERIDGRNLTNESPKRILQNCRFDAKSFDLRHTALKNDFEASVFDAEPEIKRVKETLLGHGAVRAMLSGSGASVFAVFDKQETRQATLKAIENEIHWRKFAVAAISRDQYREALELEF